jgi:hypothetical protein
MFGFKMPQSLGLGMKGSPLSQMGTSQQLQALGAAFGGDQKQLASLLGGLQGGGGSVADAPVMAGGQDISAAFSGVLPMAGGQVGGEIAGGMGLIPLLGRKLGFGKGNR